MSREPDRSRMERLGGGSHWLRAGALAALLLAGSAGLVAGPAAAQPQAPAQIQTPRIARAVAAGTAAPRAVHDLASALAQTAAVVEATVVELGAEYNDAEGPWTRVVLRDVKAHFGRAPKQLELWQFGGVLPSGRVMVAAELPVFSKGARYVLLLRNTSWNLSPVVGLYAFRVENVDGVEALIGNDGQPLVGLDASGVSYGAAMFEPAPYDGQPAARVRAPSGARDVAGSVAVSHATRPMSRAGLVAALTQATNGATNGAKLVITGDLRERPAGGFSWRGQAVARHGQAPSDGVGAAGRDTSGGAR